MYIYFLTQKKNKKYKDDNNLGQSFSMDGGWIDGAHCLEKAKAMIENGFINSALVGVSNLILRPEIQLQFQGLNLLNKSDCTKSFSSDGKFVFELYVECFTSRDLLILVFRLYILYIYI